MSPFAYNLKKIRTERNFQQKAFAEIIGCEQSYLSALETDAKVPPQKDKLTHLLKKLKLSTEEENQLRIAAKRSKRSINLPLKARMKVFEVCHALEDQLPMITDMQLELIAFALRIPQTELGEPKM